METLISGEEFTGLSRNGLNSLSIIPALLRGSLLDHFLEVAVDERETVSGLKADLAKRAGLTMDSLTATQKFMEVNQREK